MQTVSTDHLQTLVTDALQRMAFVFADDSEVTAGEVLARSSAHAAIELRGPSNYTVTVSATDGLIREVASGMMGCEPDEVDADDHGRAAVAELANVFGGELVMKISTEEETLLIGLPQELVDEEAGRLADRAIESGTACVVSSELGDLLVTIVLD
ncbi:MAG: chemotaxis protein CheX [Planctomycetes bacterium]|nr:chemotaxis protein CheX [Planctomycetota bacterium]